MHRCWVALIYTLCFGVSTPAALAQSASDPLRGSLSADAEVIGSEQELNQAAAAGGAQGDVSALRPTYREGALSKARVGARAPRFSERLSAAQARAGGGATEDPQSGIFDGETQRDRPEGLRVGRFVVVPNLTSGTGWTDNAAKTAGGEADGFYSVEGGLDARSDWSRHELALSLRGSYQAFFEDGDNNTPQFYAAADGRADLSEQTQILTRGTYSFTREARSSAENTVTTGRTASRQEFGGSIGVQRRVGVVGATASIEVDRTLYGAEASSDDSTRNNTVFSSTLRLESQGGGVLGTFVEAGGLLRRYDDECAPGSIDCVDRDAHGYQIRGGIMIDRGPKLAGELGLGWRRETPEDDQLSDLKGLLVDGSLVWSPSRRDTVTFGAQTGFEASSLDGATGSLLYSGSLAYAHQFTEDLVGDVGAAFSYREYEGIALDERDFSSTVGLTWAFSDFAALETRYTFEAFRSSEPGRNYDSSTIEAGLRLRR
ncbi:outer membrane beta-barrel protein [Pseudovibrio sp. SPO723]|uniref:outer membrane beta-barrel protein n=1 Tax=Nesiotobacter zosterae TaxID=392721 RepID=UPI0029C52843|nr:outer membrane beta-barrel protein [Pseudovibrio sp. SPO723]MDX5594714.1 outer membrane beta-barrel protein [Pseudovibrio sp. SPO723]